MVRDKLPLAAVVTSTVMKRSTANTTLSNIPTKRLKRQRMKQKSITQRFKASSQRRIQN